MRLRVHGETNRATRMRRRFYAEDCVTRLLASIVMVIGRLILRCVGMGGHYLSDRQLTNMAEQGEKHEDEDRGTEDHGHYDSRSTIFCQTALPANRAAAGYRVYPAGALGVVGFVQVRIGEDANTAVLKAEEWNVLVDLNHPVDSAASSSGHPAAASRRFFPGRRARADQTYGASSTARGDDDAGLIQLTIGASDSNIRESEVERWYTRPSAGATFVGRRARLFAFGGRTLIAIRPPGALPPGTDRSGRLGSRLSGPRACPASDDGGAVAGRTREPGCR